MSLRVWLPLNGDLHNQGLNNVTVTNNGATVSTSGKIGSCYSFDGTDDYISLTSSILYDVIKGGTIPFSIAMWVYHADATRGVLFGDYNLSGAIKFNIELTTNHNVRFYWGGSPDLTTDIIVANAEWSHIVITYDGTKIIGYLNGSANYTTTQTLSTKTKTSGSYYLGRDSRTGTTAFNGRLNDFRIYDHALSELEVKEIARAKVLHYLLNNNGLDTNIEYDISGYCNNGTKIGTFTYSTDTPKYRVSTSFDGTTNCIIVPYNNICPENIFTFNLWFKKDSLGSKNYETLFGGPSGFEMDSRQGNQSTLSLYMASKRSGKRNLVTELTFNTWYMVTMVRDGIKERYYINGIFQSEIDAKSMPTGIYRIGAFASNTGQNYYGNISDFRIYATALSAQDILSLYHNSALVDEQGNIHGAIH